MNELQIRHGAALTALLLLAAGLPAAAFSARPAQDVPAAVVVQVEGAVELHREGRVSPAAVGDRLAEGDRLVPAAGGRAVLVSRDGGSRAITEATTIDAPPSAPSGEMFSRTVRVLAQAATTDARSQPNRQGMIRPLPGQPALVAPRNDLVVLDGRPGFTWFAVPGATGYRIQIRREGEAPRRFEAGADTTWTLPDDVRLDSGAYYRWTVAPVGSGRVAQEGGFRVLDEGGRRAVGERLAELGELGLDPEREGLFLAAVIYREAGLAYEAARALERMERSGAPAGPAVHLLRGDVLNALGDLDAAAAAFDRADALERGEASARSGSGGSGP